MSGEPTTSNTTTGKPISLRCWTREKTACNATNVASDNATRLKRLEFPTIELNPSNVTKPKKEQGRTITAKSKLNKIEKKNEIISSNEQIKFNLS